MNDGTPRLGHGFRFQWEPAQDCHVLLYPEGMIKLNRSAGEILARCDGTRSVRGIVAELEQTFATAGLAGEVESFIAIAVEKRWLRLDQETR
ncbi:pyrroloquinoline quinone biosynthesis peptide chaperone PqqD [Azonexus caeni]|jgi:pyrroloquinoline quinone biosynthesis protein D|uniref:pyrroloquinoline quinone biosynthesis peptide chaperone PqqD n=1 Tax=Azonexus caeni TaxID=266126 RepID=UPI003A8A12E5